MIKFYEIVYKEKRYTRFSEESDDLSFRFWTLHGSKTEIEPKLFKELDGWLSKHLREVKLKRILKDDKVS